MVLTAFQSWGTDCFKRLKGDFAVVIVDQQTSTAYLAVDLCGNRHLYWRQTGKLITISNQIQMLRTERTALDKNMLCRNYFRLQSFQSVPLQATLYEGIKKIPAGHFALISQDVLDDEIKIQLQRYWSRKSITPLTLPRKEFGGVVEHFQHLFEQAVERRLASNDAVAAHLSGGFDSSSVAAVTAKVFKKSAKPLYAFVHTLETQPETTVPIKGRSVRELHYAQAVARLYPNIRLYTIVGRQASVLDLIDRQIKHSAGYSLNFDNMGYLSDIAEQASKLGASNILTGERGNMGFSYSGIVHRSVWKQWARKILRRDSRPKLWDPLPIRSGAASTAFIERFQSVKPNQQIDDPIDLFMNDRPHDIAAYFKNCMGVEHCDPTTDIDLISFVWSLPNWVFFEKGESRRLVRAAAKAWLPDEIRFRKDRGLQGGDSLNHFKHNTRQIRQAMQPVELTREYFDWQRLGLYVDEVERTSPHNYTVETMHKINSVYGAIAVNKLCLSEAGLDRNVLNP